MNEHVCSKDGVIQQLRIDVEVLKRENSGIKEDINNIKTEIKDVREEMKEISKKIDSNLKWFIGIGIGVAFNLLAIMLK